MPATRCFAVSIGTAGRRRLAACIAVLGVVGVAPATATALPEVVVAMPDSVIVGQTGVAAQLTLRNTSQSPATICNVGVGQCKTASEGIIFIPSCASTSSAPTCSGPDPGVFAFAATAAVPVGSCGTNALITGFDVTVADAGQGKLRLVPNGGMTVTLGAAGTPTATCDIPLRFDVARLPASDGAPEVPGVQTRQSASVDAVIDAASGPSEERGTGQDVTTVVPPVVLPPPAVVPPPALPPPVVPPAPPAPRAPDNLDHFKCYEVLQPNFRQRGVGLRDQFGQRRSRVLRARQLCNPVSKDGGRVLQPRAHLVCYETRDQNTAFTHRTVLVTNQFGQRRLTVTRPSSLCVPSLKRTTAGALPSTPDPARLVDHFRCYDVRAQPAARTVKLVDQFGTSEAKVIEVNRLCNPVRKNNEPVRRPGSHLVCYAIRDAQPFNALGVRVRNQFGSAALRVRRPQTLCLPSFKEVVATAAPATAPRGLDHFKCYEAEQPNFQPRFVGLRDQFGHAEAKVLTTRQLCNPVSKNNGRVLNSRAHLVCYETTDAGVVPFKPLEVRVSNQFGIRRLPVVQPVSLCVPSLKRRGSGAAPTGPNPALVLDHFRCYDVKPQPVARTVKLVDQFKTTKTKVLQVVRLCNPVRKNNEPVRRPRAHLVCYSIFEASFQPLAVTVRNQFGVAAQRVRRPQTLCLPSFKQLVTAAGAVVTPNSA